MIMEGSGDNTRKCGTFMREKNDIYESVIESYMMMIKKKKKFMELVSWNHFA